VLGNRFLFFGREILCAGSASLQAALSSEFYRRRVLPIIHRIGHGPGGDVHHELAKLDGITGAGGALKGHGSPFAPFAGACLDALKSRYRLFLRRERRKIVDRPRGAAFFGARDGPFYGALLSAARFAYVVCLHDPNMARCACHPKSKKLGFYSVTFKLTHYLP